MRNRWKYLFVSALSLGLLTSWALGLHGCVTIEPAATKRGQAFVVPQDLPEDAWPVRHPEPLAMLIQRSQRAAAEGDIPGHYLDRVSRILGMFSARLQHEALGRGVVAELPQPPGNSARQLVFITNRFEAKDFERALDTNRPTRAEKEKLLRWHFRLEMPDRQPRGLIVHLTSIGDRRFEAAVSRTLKNRGWAVLHVVPGRITVPFLHENVRDEGRRIVDAAEVAQTMDEYGADYAYAVEGVLDYLRVQQPDLPQDPLVITGYSAGSLALPTIAARLGDRVHGAVFVGSGANVAGILVDGKITNVVGVLRRTGEPHLLEDLRALPAQYLVHSRFDPYHTARYLHGKPVLMLQGQFDQIVPPQYGDVLYERLGQPERWSYPLGHIMLFWALPMQAGHIADWIERQTADRRAVSGSAGRR